MRLVGTLLIGLAGVALLVALGVWQVQRLGWKQGILAEIEGRVGGVPVAVPPTPDPGADRYLPVRAEGATTGTELHVLVSTRETGAGYRVVVPFETADGRRLMVDLGIVPAADKLPARPAQRLAVTGNLHWPDEVDGFTPEPDRSENIWFARDVAAMADALGTEPILIVARQLDPEVPGVVPRPIGIEGIPNDHLSYAITWFSLAAIWAGMTGLLLWRMRRPAGPRPGA